LAEAQEIANEINLLCPDEILKLKEN